MKDFTTSISRRELVIGSIGTTLGLGTGYGTKSFLTDESESSVQTENTEIPQIDEPEPNQGDLPINIFNRPKLGSLSSPIRIIYWMDLLCPFCYRFAQETLPQLKEEYIDSDDVVIIFKTLPLLGGGSNETAVGTHALYDLGIGDEYINWKQDVMEYYHENDDLPHNWFKPIELRHFAEENGVSGDSYVSYIGSNPSILENRIEQDQSDYRAYGGSSEQTPFFVIYDSRDIEPETLFGAQPYEEFEQIIESVRVEQGDSNE